MARWMAPRRKYRRHAKVGRPKGYISSDMIDWTDEMRRSVVYHRRQLKLPLRIVAAVVGVSLRALIRKMTFWRMPLRLKEYAPRKVRDDFIQRYKVYYTHAYDPRQEGEE